MVRSPRPARSPRLVGVAVGLAAVIGGGLSACGDDIIGATAAEARPAPGIEVTIVREGLARPTQITFDGDGALLVAELDGLENDGTGTIARIDGDGGGERDVLYTDLDKPTGIAWFGDRIWVMESNRLSHGSALGGEWTVVAEDLPSNGRSEGTLTVIDDTRMLYDTSGDEDGGVVAPDSGRIWRVSIDSPTSVDIVSITEVASGFKHAYAQTVDDRGQLWSVEVSDGGFDGNRATDEVVPVTEGADHGWPWCVGDNRPVEEHGGSAEDCAQVPRPLGVFGKDATPTSVVVAPWDPDLLVVALWNTGEVVAVDIDGPDAQEPDVLVSGLANPLHLLPDGDSLLVSEFGRGRLLRIAEG